MNWMPIESAPKVRGMKIRARWENWGNGAHIGTAWWLEGDPERVDRWLPVDGYPPEGAVLTGWMPLPEPPKDK